MLLVVVPAKPWRAKHRLAALRINCRRKSLVMRRVLMLVSKHSPYQKSRILLQCTRWKFEPCIGGPKPTRRAAAQGCAIFPAAGRDYGSARDCSDRGDRNSISVSREGV